MKDNLTIGFYSHFGFQDTAKHSNSDFREGIGPCSIAAQIVKESCGHKL